MAAPSRVLVVPTGGGVDASHLAHVRTAIAALPDTQVVGDAETAETLASVTVLGVECVRTEAPCAARIGALGGVDRVVVLSQKDGTHTLLLVDVITTEQRRVSRQTTGIAGADLASAFSTAVVELFTPERYVGALELTGGPAGASVVVDGAEVGVLPLAGPLSLTPGARRVAVTHQGSVIFEQSLDIGYGTSTAISVEVPPLSTTSTAPVDEPLAVLPLSLLIGGAAVLGVSVVASVLLAAALSSLTYLGCAELPSEQRGSEGNYLACFAFLPIYSETPVEAPVERMQLLTATVVGVVALVGALLGLPVGGGVAAASFFVE